MKKLCSVIILSFLAACATTDREEQILNKISTLPAEEIISLADELLQQEEYDDARTHYKFIYENFPNSPSSVRALIGLADSLYREGGWEQIIQAFYRYEDFFNRFPQAKEARHALYMMGVTTYYQHKKASLDTVKTREALSYFTRYQELYPDSDNMNEVDARIHECKEILADHEYIVAAFYFKRGIQEASLKRLDYLWTTYPDSVASYKGYLLAMEIFGEREMPDRVEEYRLKSEQHPSHGKI